MAFADWKGTEFVPYLLPIIPYGSKINHTISRLSDDKVGKLPGKWHSDAGWVGFPKWREYRAADKDLDWWQKWYDHEKKPATIGMRLGDFIFIDIDVTHIEVAQSIAAAFQVLCGLAPVRFRENSSKCGLLYRLDHKRAQSFVRKSRFVFGDSFEEHAVEILGEGEQFVCEGLHPTGVLHQWSEPVQLANLTPITGGDIEQAMSMVRDIIRDAGFEVHHASAADRQYDSANAKLIGEGDVAPDLDALAEILRLIPADIAEFSGYSEWFTAVCAIKQACGGDQAFYHDHVVPWARAVPDNLETIDEHGTTYLETKWDSITATEVGFEFLEGVAHSYGYVGDAQREFEAVDDGTDQPAVSSGPPLAPDLQTKCVDRFVEKHAHQDRLVVAGRTRGQGEWFTFEDGLWRPHLTPLYDTRVVCEEIAQPISRLPGATNATRTRVLHSEHTHAAVERMLRQHPDLVVSRSKLDAGDIVFGVPGGYVDAAGELHEPDPRMLITRSTRCAPADTEDCPVFKKRVSELFSGDKDQLACFRSFCGYMMTGRGREQKFLFIHGQQGGEGKSSALQIIADVLGDYASPVPYEAFVMNKHNRFAFSDVPGKRMIYCSEVNKAETWNDTLLKDMTGGVPVITEAKFMAQQVTPLTWGMIFSGNNMPRFQSADTALQHRMVTLRVFRQLDKSAVDLNFRSYAVEHEGPGILRWLVNAMTEYLSVGHLVIPESVKAVSDEYFHDQDKFGLWLEENVEYERGALTSVEALRAHFNVWGEVNEHETWKASRFSATLKGRHEMRLHQVKFDRQRIDGVQLHCAVGLKLREADDDRVTENQ